jgi:hypothetical protein
VEIAICTPQSILKFDRLRLREHAEIGCEPFGQQVHVLEPGAAYQHDTRSRAAQFEALPKALSGAKAFDD